jgi:hypothetical protein
MNFTALPTPAASSMVLASRPAAVAGVRATRVVVTVTSAVIAVCAFAFSFGNIWHLALAWGVPAPIAPLVAPMLDVSVVGLMIAVRQLSLHGVPGRALAGARLLMLTCAVTTWGLNIAQAVLDHRWGGVVIDSVAPALLLGWAEVGPTLLRLTTTPAASPASGEGHVAAVNEAATPAASSDGATGPAIAASGHTLPPGWAATTMSPDEIDGLPTAATPLRWRTPGNATESSGTSWGSSDGEGDLPHVA